MRKLIKHFFRLFWSLFPYRIWDRVGALLNLIYTEKIRGAFGSLGSNATIMRSIKILGGKNIFIGENFYCYWGVRMEAYTEHNKVRFSPKILIGNGVSINPDCHIAAINSVELHDGVMLASRVFITDHFHGNTTTKDLALPPSARILYSKGNVTIKRNAWIGEGVAVMPGVIIGENVIVGANSVVTCDIPDNAIAAGAPARVIKQLADE